MVHSRRGPDRRGASLVFRRQLAMMAKRRAMKPAHLTAQGKPILGVRYCTVAGKTVLPVPLPTAARAKANERLL